MEVGEGRVRTMPCILRFFWTLAGRRKYCDTFTYVSAKKQSSISIIVHGHNAMHSHDSTWI